MTKENKVIVNSFVYCIGSMQRKNPDGKEALVIDGMINSINPQYVPGMFSFGIVFALFGVDYKKNTALSVKFGPVGADPMIEMNNIILDMKLYDTLPKINIPMEYKGITMNIDARNAIFVKEGLYETTIYINEDEIGRYPIYVKGIVTNEPKS